MNYGYAVVRSGIARKLVAIGFHPTFGIHHDGQLNACIIDNVKVNVTSAIDIMEESLKRIILENSSEELKLPLIIPIEDMEGITE